MDRLFKTDEARSTALSVAAILAVLLAVGLGWLYVAHAGLRTYTQEVETELASTTDMLRVRDQQNEELRLALESEQNRLRDLGEQVEDLTGTIDDLEKLAETDKQLLQKYSKVFFLNEHYEPPKLSSIRKQYLYDESKEQEILSGVRRYLEDMIDDAKDDDVELFVRSAYRSFGTQATLKTGYSVTYGSGANTFSADQGYSEHQLGTTVDFTTTGLNGGLDGFQNTPAYEWLLDNAYRYGFVLSYPQGNAYYQFEPWHWRFVSRDLARYLHKKDLNFYDVDQRTIDEYLIDFFD